MKKINLADLEIQRNSELSNLLIKQGITKLSLTAIGSSISSGYSYTRITKPLLFRNETIREVFENNELDLIMNHFAKSINNNDEHVFNSIIQNIKISQMNKLNRIDTKLIRTYGIGPNELESYYPLIIPNDIGIKDIILDSTPALANIVIYNGGTGSFLDNITRHGKHKLTRGIKRDLASIHATFKLIQHHNRHNGSNTQIYLCGAPQVPLYASDIFINSNLSNLSKEYANSTYIPSFSRKLLYKTIEEKIFPDTHYDEEEYRLLNIKIIEKIVNDYFKIKIKIDIDRSLYKISKNIELGKQHFQKHLVLETIDKVLNNSNIENVELDKFVNELENYVLERFPHDFYYLGIDNVRNDFKELKKIKY